MKDLITQELNAMLIGSVKVLAVFNSISIEFHSILTDFNLMLIDFV